MTIKICSTKSFLNLPCGHAQFFDKEPDGSPGDCASLHGYDRSVHLTFSGEIDEQGWIYPFGELKEVKSFIEYYFDHTTVLPANDPRIGDIPDKMMEPGGLFYTIRILPYGVSMEMSSLFLWEQINPYIWQTTSGRVILQRVEVREHERNSGFILVDERSAQQQARTVINIGKTPLDKRQAWSYKSPIEVLRKYNIGEVQ